jgi:hypothetical protein
MAAQRVESLDAAASPHRGVEVDEGKLGTSTGGELEVSWRLKARESSEKADTTASAEKLNESVVPSDEESDLVVDALEQIASGDGSSTTDLGSLFATEGTTQCPGGGDCFTLQLAFKITNTTANPTFYTSSRTPPTFVAGDPSNNFTESAFDPFLCMLPVGAGKSCVVFFNYSTTDLMGISDFDGDFAVNSAKLTITSHNPVPPPMLHFPFLFRWRTLTLLLRSLPLSPCSPPASAR